MDFSPSEKLKRFFATSRPTLYKKGDIVLRTGEATRGAFYIKTGFIKDSGISFDGHEFTLFIFKPKDVYSYSWIFNQTPNNHSFRALTDCIIYEKSREGFLLLLEQNPDIQFMIAQKVVTRMGGLMQRMEHLAFGTASQKVGSMLYILGERFGKQTEKKITISLSLTHQDIAELIGLSRETTSIEVKKFMDKGIITRISGHYVLVKIKTLQKLSNLVS